MKQPSLGVRVWLQSPSSAKTLLFPTAAERLRDKASTCWSGVGITLGAGTGLGCSAAGDRGDKDRMEAKTNQELLRKQMRKPFKGEGKGWKQDAAWRGQTWPGPLVAASPAGGHRGTLVPEDKGHEERAKESQQNKIREGRLERSQHRKVARPVWLSG